MPPGQEQVTIVVDVSCDHSISVCRADGYQYASATAQSNPSISKARNVLHILQNHYVESEA